METAPPPPPATACDKSSPLRSRVVECRAFANSASTGNTPLTKRLRVTQRGVELHHPSSPPSLHEEDNEEGIESSSEKRSSVSVARNQQSAAAAKEKAQGVLPHEVIRWEDILGAAVLTGDEQAETLVPGYTRSSSKRAKRAMEFVVFGCVVKPKASIWQSITFGSKFDAFSCFGRSSESQDAPAAAAMSDRNSFSSASAAYEKPPQEEAPGLRERILVQWVFRYAGDDAKTYVSQVVRAIQSLADPRIAHSIKPWTPGQEPPQLSRRKYLVLINPAGGTGRAQQLYDTVVAPMMQQSNIECEVLITQRQYHASDVVAKVPLNTYDCIVAVGGDGLLSEILQGIMKRPDWEQAIQQPLGIIPGGSGNGLAVSLLHRSGEAMEALNASYALVKGSANELDITSISNSNQDVKYSFLSLEWAFIADVDIESERYRFFGGIRFTIASVAKILSRHNQYNGTLRYLSSEADARPPAKYHERVRDPLASKEEEVRPALDCLSQQQKAQSQHLKQDPLVVAAGNGSTGEWKEISGSFHMFWGMNVSHAASDGHIAPTAAMDDGYYYLMLMEGPYSRLSVAKMLMGLEDGSHIGQKRVQLIRTRAFTLHTENPADRLCVDGELFHGPDIQKGWAKGRSQTEASWMGRRKPLHVQRKRPREDAHALERDGEGDSDAGGLVDLVLDDEEEDEQSANGSTATRMMSNTRRKKKQKRQQASYGDPILRVWEKTLSEITVGPAQSLRLTFRDVWTAQYRLEALWLEWQVQVQHQERENSKLFHAIAAFEELAQARVRLSVSSGSIVIGLELNAPAGMITFCTDDDDDGASAGMKMPTDMTLQELIPETNATLSAHLVNLVQDELLVMEIIRGRDGNGDEHHTVIADCDSLVWRVGIAWRPYHDVITQDRHQAALPPRNSASCHRSMHHVMIWLLRNARGVNNQCEYPYWKEIDVLYDQFVGPVGSESLESVAFDIHDIYARINTHYQLERDMNNFEEASMRHGATNLLPKLRPYQKAAVSWMLSRENPEANADQRRMNVLVQFPVSGSQRIGESPATTLAYDPFCARFFSLAENEDDRDALLHSVSLPSSFNLSSVRGGILADEMGLGKTVEVITLVLCNPWPEARPVLQTLHQVPSYDPETSVEDEESMERDCICGSTDDEELGWVQCDFCETWHHQLCTGYSSETELFADRTHEQASLESHERYTASLFMCFHCQATEKPEFACKTTLIVSPEAIHDQWETELKRHVKPGILKLLRYPGVKALRSRLASLRGSPSAEWKILASAGLEMSSYDVVLTTYEALSSDLYHLPTDIMHERRSSTRQKRKKYAFVASPLIFLKFWRVCMDEAQVGVENAQLQAALTVAKIKAKMKWVVTGTPFSTQVGDLFGCFKFLRLAPYDDEALGSQLFKEIVEKCFSRGAIERVLDILLWDGDTTATTTKRNDGGGLLWRTAKKDVLSQLNLPDQLTELIWCRFSDVERHFYDEQEKVIVAMVKEYQRQSQRALDNGSGNSNDSSSADVTEKIWQDLLVLRQICCHPQVGSTLSGMFSLRNGKSAANGEANGNSGAGGGGVLSMDEFLQELILKCKRECEEGQRKYLAAQNGLASLYLITHETPVAVLKYLTSIQVIKGNWDLFRADLLPRLHILENLACCVRTVFKIEVDESSESSDNNGDGNRGATNAAASSSSLIRKDLNILETEMSDISNNPKENSLLPDLPALTQAIATNETGEVVMTENASADAVARECEVLDVCASKIKKFYLYQVEASHSAAFHSFEAIAKAVEDDSLPALARLSVLKKRRVLCSSSLWWVTALSKLEKKAPEQVLLFADRLRARLLSFGTKWASKFCNSFSTIAGFQVVFLNELEELSKKRTILYDKLRKMSTKPPTKKDVELSGNCKKCRDARDGTVCDHCKLYKELEAFKQHFLGIDSTAASENRPFSSSVLSSRRGERSSGGIYDDVDDGEGAAANPVNTSSLLMEVFREIAGSTRAVMAVSHHSDDEMDQVTPQEGLREELEFWTQVQKEWNAAKKLFQVQHQRLGGLDELEMATMQIRVRLEGEEVKTAAEKLYKLQEHEVPLKFASFESERVVGELEMREKLARLRFLLQLEKQRHRSDDSDDQPSTVANSDEGEGTDVPTRRKKRSACAVCLEEMENERVMLPCAHSFCKNCMKTLSRQHKATASLKCPTCRRMCNVARAVVVVEESDSSTSNGRKRGSFTNSARPLADAHIHLQRGGYGSKIDAILRRVLSLSQQNTQVKCLLFTQWQDMMSIVATHLKRNGIMCFTYTTKKNFHRVMQQFKMHADPCVLALPFKVGANGLNLVEATEVLLVEPLLNTSIEAQAINRVHRIGQTKQTRVHRLVVDNSVEERIYWLGQKRKKARGSFTGTESEAKEDNETTDDAGVVVERAPTKKEKEQLTLNDLHVLLDGKMGSKPNNDSNGIDEEGERHPFWQEQVLLNGKTLSRIEAKLFIERLHAAECRANGQSAEDDPQTHLFDQELNLVVANEVARLQHATALEQSQSISTELLAFHRARLAEELELWRSATGLRGDAEAT